MNVYVISWVTNYSLYNFGAKFQRLFIGESLFTLFASCLSLSDDANKIKTLNIERA